MYGWHDRSRSIWSEEYQMDLLSEMCEYFKSHPCLNGLAFWLFADVKSFNATTGVLERPRTFNNKGTLDEHRRPKLAYDKIKQEFAEILNRK
jgi:beta-glucuronidase